MVQHEKDREAALRPKHDGSTGEMTKAELDRLRRPGRSPWEVSGSKPRTKQQPQPKVSKSLEPKQLSAPETEPKPKPQPAPALPVSPAARKQKFRPSPRPKLTWTRMSSERREELLDQGRKDISHSLEQLVLKAEEELRQAENRLARYRMALNIFVNGLPPKEPEK